MPSLTASMDGLSARVASNLRQADPRLSRIAVEVNDSSVKLTGTVPTFYLRALALSTTNRVSGVGRIYDQIAVPIVG